MNVNISKNLETVLPAVFPQSCVSDSMKRYGAGLIGLGIQIVIANELSYRQPLAVLRAKQESAAFALLGAPISQFED